MKKIRTVIIGAASITWMPTFLNDLSQSEAMRGGEIILHDVNSAGVEKMEKFGQKLIKERGVDISILPDPDLEHALKGADFVICTVLVGSHKTWKKEMDTLIKYGIHHPKGMSVGPGGIGMGLRQIPWMVNLARIMEKVCPNAWLLNFSNPMQTIIYAIQKYTSIKVLGLCHGVKHSVKKLAEKIGSKESEMFYTIGGVNHFETITRMSKNGKNVLDKIADTLEKEQKEQGGTGEIITTELYRLFGGFPCNEDIHVIEFLPHYLHKNTNLEIYEQEQNRIENRISKRDQAWKLVDQYISGAIAIEKVVHDRSEELAEIVDSMVFNKPMYLYANVLNKGYVANLDSDMCVEVPLVIFRDGFIGCAIGDLPRPLAVLHNIHGAVQCYTAEAAMKGSRKDALVAMTLDPMCYTLSTAERENLLDEILKVSAEFLPDYWHKKGRK